MGKVLLVEDNFDNRMVYRTILEYSGHEVEEALDGETGVRLAREGHPDVILMDVSIPVMDGWQATEALKADAATRDIPIVILTAHALASDRKKAEEVGADGYISKPAEPRTVLAEVDRWMR